MTKFYIMVAVLLGSLAFIAPEASACARNDTECNRATNGVIWKGSGQVKNPIKVTVCHGYWDRLNVGSMRGVETRWWEPVMVYGSWKSNRLPTITNRCKTYWVKPGTKIAVYASCVNRVIWTEAMHRPGTYTLR